MTPRVRDLVSTVLVLAVVLPYLGHLLLGRVPLVEDTRGMAAVALVLGFFAFVTARGRDGLDGLAGLDRTELVLGTAMVLLGGLALVLSESAAAEALLGAFVGVLVITWAVEMADHTGLASRSRRPRR